MALITTLTLCARSQDLVMSVSVRRVHVALPTLLDLRAGESRVVRHVKPPRSVITLTQVSRDFITINPGIVIRENIVEIPGSQH